MASSGMRHQHLALVATRLGPDVGDLCQMRPSGTRMNAICIYCTLMCHTGQFNEHIRLFETLYQGKLKGYHCNSRLYTCIYMYIHVYTCIYIKNMLHQVIYELSFGTMTFDLYQMA